MNGLLILILLIAGTVFLFKAFDRITGRDPKQISDGTEHSRQMRAERECPHCGEVILKKAQVCKHCGRDVEPARRHD